MPDSVIFQTITQWRVTIEDDGTVSTPQMIKGWTTIVGAKKPKKKQVVSLKVDDEQTTQEF
jgi:hypothetical protein